MNTNSGINYAKNTVHTAKVVQLHKSNFSEWTQHLNVILPLEGDAAGEIFLLEDYPEYIVEFRLSTTRDLPLPWDTVPPEHPRWERRRAEDAGEDECSECASSTTTVPEAGTENPPMGNPNPTIANGDVVTRDVRDMLQKHWHDTGVADWNTYVFHPNLDYSSTDLRIKEYVKAVPKVKALILNSIPKDLRQQFMTHFVWKEAVRNNALLELVSIAGQIVNLINGQCKYDIASEWMSKLDKFKQGALSTNSFNKITCQLHNNLKAFCPHDDLQHYKTMLIGMYFKNCNQDIHQNLLREYRNNSIPIPDELDQLFNRMETEYNANSKAVQSTRVTYNDTVPLEYANMAVYMDGTKHVPKSMTTHVNSVQQVPEKEVCRNFKNKKCRFGNKCRHAHVLPDGTLYTGILHSAQEVLSDKKHSHDKKRKFNDKHHEKSDKKGKPNNDLSKIAKLNLPFCVFNAAGKCRFGDKCNKSHVTPNEAQTSQSKE